MNGMFVATCSCDREALLILNTPRRNWKSFASVLLQGRLDCTESKMTLRSVLLCLWLALCSVGAAAQSPKQFLVTPDPAKTVAVAPEDAARAAQPSDAVANDLPHPNAPKPA